MSNLKSSWTDGKKLVRVASGYKGRDFDLYISSNGFQTTSVTLDEDMLRQAQVVLTRFVDMLDGQGFK